MKIELTEPPNGIIMAYRLTIIVLMLALSSYSLAENNDIQYQTQSLSLSDQPIKSHSNQLIVKGCSDYPYHDNRNQIHYGNQRLLSDIKTGLAQGLMCLTGQDPAIGKFHPYHHQQAFKLMELIAVKNPNPCSVFRMSYLPMPLPLHLIKKFRARRSLKRSRTVQS